MTKKLVKTGPFLRKKEDTIERISQDTPKVIKELCLLPYTHFGNIFSKMGFMMAIDLGCGEGLGTKELIKYFDKVIAVDKEKLGEIKNFIQSDVCNIKKIKNKSIDVTFCFEVIEHLEPERQELLLKEMERISELAFVLGSVNKDGPNMVKNTEIFKGKKNPYHLKELTQDDFRQIGSKFEKVFYSQSIFDGKLKIVNEFNEQGICNYLIVKL